MVRIHPLAQGLPMSAAESLTYDEIANRPAEAALFFAISLAHWAVTLFLVFGVFLIRSRWLLKVYTAFVALVLVQKLVLGVCVMTLAEMALLDRIKGHETQHGITDLLGARPFIGMTYVVMEPLGIPADEQGFFVFSNICLALLLAAACARLKAGHTDGPAP